jgi:FkbM family methyltransferase
MSRLRQIAQEIRHLPGLEGAEGLWRALRKPYHWLLNRGGGGVEVLVGGKAAIRMPAEYTGGNWEEYEPQSIAAFAGWVREHPDALVLDLGSSTGIFSAVALFGAPRAEVIAFDSDLASLAAARRMCQHAAGDRLRLVHGFLTCEPSERVSIDEAVRSTETALSLTGVRGDVGTTKYTCLTDPGVGSIPSRSLDDLFPKPFAAGRAMLIKCDVEGAELLVLRGAQELLRRETPTLLLSVHPPALPSYGHSTEEVRAFLDDLGYDIKCIAVDHEEHWWCEPRAAPR